MKIAITIFIYTLLFAAPTDAAFAQQKPQPAKAPEANTAKATSAEPTVGQILRSLRNGAERRDRGLR
jgi:hypothetical protein